MNESTNTYRVLCVDDAPDVSLLCQRLIDAEPDMQCVGALASADGLLEAVRAHGPDVVLLDLSMPGRDALEALRELSAEFPDCRVLCFSGYDDHARVDAALEAGAWGLLSKHTAPESLVAAIRRVMAGELVKQRP